MKCYIYKIINKITGEKYVGQTLNFSRRISDHFYQLKKHTHRNQKLQQAYDTWGKENFIIEKQEYNLTTEELNALEIQIIEQENSFEQGYNQTRGGGGYGRGGREKLNFEQFCFAYFGNKKYSGMTVRTAKYLGVDSASIAAIRREASYDDYRQKALKLPKEVQEKYLEDFQKILEVDTFPPKIQRKKMGKKEIFYFLAVVTVYGRGAEAAMTRQLQISGGLKNHIVHGEYSKEYTEFKQLPEQQIVDMAESYFKDNNLQQYSKKLIKKREELLFPL